MVIRTMDRPTTWEQAPVEYVTSKDGTRLGYRQFGHGAGLVLVQGTMGTALHFKELAEALAPHYTVCIPDRRGRGMSEGSTDGYTAQKDVEDLDVLLRETGAQFVFGLSAGALITLQAALTLPTLHKFAIFEPPLFVDNLPTQLIARFESEMAQGKLESAMVSAMLAARMGPAIFGYIPRWLLERFVKMGMAQEAKKGAGKYPTMRELSGTLRYDLEIVREMSGPAQRFQAIENDVLLLGGSQSPAYLKAALDALDKVLPHATRIELEGVGHSAPWNADQRGKPELVAQALHGFFG